MIRITVKMFDATMIAQMVHSMTRCHLFAAVPIRRTSSNKAESLPNVDDTTDSTGAMRVYLTAFVRSPLSAMESLGRPRPNVVATVTSAEHVTAEI